MQLRRDIARSRVLEIDFGAGGCAEVDYQLKLGDAITPLGKWKTGNLLAGIVVIVLH